MVFKRIVAFSDHPSLVSRTHIWQLTTRFQGIWHSLPSLCGHLHSHAQTHTDIAHTHKSLNRQRLTGKPSHPGHWKPLYGYSPCYDWIAMTPQAHVLYQGCFWRLVLGFGLFWDRSSLYSFSCPETHYGDGGGLELTEILIISVSQVLTAKACTTISLAQLMFWNVLPSSCCVGTWSKNGALWGEFWAIVRELQENKLRVLWCQFPQSILCFGMFSCSSQV